MKSQLIQLGLVPLLVSFAAPISVRAGDIALYEWGLLQDGIVTGIGDPLPSGSTLDESTGLGTVRLAFAGTGAHHGVLFVDHEMSESINSFFNELGSTSVGAPPAGLSWEIDEPGFSVPPGDIYFNFLDNTLDNSIGFSTEDDVSMALGWNFVLAAGETAEVLFQLSETQPSGFHLRQQDPDSGELLFFSSSLRIIGPSTSVSDGDVAMPALALGAFAMVAAWRARSAKRPF